MPLQIIDMHNVKFNRNKHTRIDRKSKWGNPFVMKNPDDEDERIEVLWKYTLYLLRSPHILKYIPTLDGKTLACWCVPKKCHGQILGYLLEHPSIIDKCYKLCVDKEVLAEKIFQGLGWEHKNTHVQTTLLDDRWISVEWDSTSQTYRELTHQKSMKALQNKNKTWTKQYNNKKQGKSRPAVCK